MPDLHVRGLPPGLHEQLREQARADGRSMSAEAAILLKQALESSHRSAQQNAAIDRLREIQHRSGLSPGAPSSEDMVREDRDSHL